MKQTILVLLCSLVLLVSFSLQAQAMGEWDFLWNNDDGGGQGGGCDPGDDPPTPVPEPATLLTLGLGAAGLYVARKKFKK